MTTAPSSPRRLLIISYHFPPDGAIGGMRWAGFSKYLARLGWEMHVITTSPNAGANNIPGVHVHVRARRRTLNDLYNIVAKRLKTRRATQAHGASGAPASAAPPHPAPPTGPHKGTPIRSLRQVAGQLLAFPDDGRGWLLRAAGTARKLLRSQRFDAVITSGPPHSTHIAGVWATMGSGVPLWIDMRDPWTEPVLMYSRDSFTRFMVPRLERFVQRHARAAIVTTVELAATLRMSARWLPVVHVSNGVDVEHLPAGRPAPAGGCVLAYAGTLYAGRNLTPVLDAMSELVRDRPALRTSLRLRIAGNINPRQRATLDADLAKGGIESLVELLPAVSRSAALELLNDAHLALVPAQRQHLMIPAKIYESMALGIPTLVIAEPSSSAAMEAKRIGAFTVDVDDVKGVRRIIEDILAGRGPSRVAPAAPISHEFLAAQIDTLFREGIQPT